MTWQAARRARDLKTSVFSEMSDLLAKHGAVNLGQGFPDFPAPRFVKDAAKRAIDRDLNQYAHPHGVSALRQAVADEWGRRFDLEIDPEREVTVTSGAAEAIFDAILAMIDPGDEVVAFEPTYDSYHASVQLAGGVMRTVRLDVPGWTFSLDDLRAAATGSTRVILLNTPHNPTGKVFTRTELQAIADLAIERDIIVVTDEVYDRIVYDHAEHVPIATLPGMWEQTLTINSTGKTFSVTGWKIGYAVGPEHLVAALRTVHQYVTFASSTPFQVAMAEAIVEARINGYYDTLASEYRARRDTLGAILDGAGLPVEPVQGSFFLMASYAGFGFESDVEFCRRLITQVGETPIPSASFYVDQESVPKLVRFCFAKQLSTLIEAGNRLGRVNPGDLRVAAD